LKLTSTVLTISTRIVSGVYTLGVLGVQRTPYETEHDVTFSRSWDQGKLTKKL